MKRSQVSSSSLSSGDYLKRERSACHQFIGETSDTWPLVQLRRSKCLKLKVRQNVGKAYTSGSKTRLVGDAGPVLAPVVHGNPGKAHWGNRGSHFSSSIIRRPGSRKGRELTC